MTSSKSFRNLKRWLSEVEHETSSSLQPPAKQQKLEEDRRHQTPSSFWDNLSRQWLARRTLREFNRRTVWPFVPIPPHWTSKEKIDLVKLKRFASQGGPDLGDIRGYPDPKTLAMDSGSRKQAKIGRGSDASSLIRRISAYDPSFEQHLIDHGVYPHGHYHGSNDDSVYPNNWEEIMEILAQPQPSLSPSHFTWEEFENFEEIDMQALTENKVMSKVFPIIAGTADILSQENLQFTNLKDLTDGSITKGQPNLYDGARPEDLNKQIQEELGLYIVPLTNTAAPCLPNFFTECKGHKGPADVNEMQAMYDGALGARGIHELRSYIDPETAYDNNAYTITSTYHAGIGHLTIYCTHPTPSKNPQNPIEYRMTQLRGWKMTGSPDAFRQGASALRNAREWAKEQRGKLITAANGKVSDSDHSDLVSSTQSFVSLSSNTTLPGSETSADELALDPGMFHSSSHTTPVQARTYAPLKGSTNWWVKKVSQDKKRAGRHAAVQDDTALQDDTA